MLINIIFSFIFILKLSSEEYITIPFKIISNKEPDIFNSIEDYLYYWQNLCFYSELLIGTPKQKILTKLTFEDYGISILNKGCDYNSYLMNIEVLKNLPNNSKSFNKTKDMLDEESFNYKSFYDAYYAKDIFYFNSNRETKLKFIYSPNDNKKLSTCLNIGFMAYTRNLRESSLNIITQLKRNDYIESYDWSILLNEGIFLLGAKPHEYNPEIYDEQYLYGSAYFHDDLIAYFNLKVNNIYFNSPIKSEKIFINDTDILYLNPTKGLIKGTSDYEKKIEKYFFNDFIIQQKCFKEITKDNKYRTFYCINNPSIENELKSKFPTIYFVHKNFLMEFELNYDDLFRTKGNKIYFLVWFDSSSRFNIHWEMGFPFMKKYLFNYNYDNKLISFYNDKIKEKDIQQMNSNNKISTNSILLIIFLSLIICILGFLLGRKMIRKKRLTAKELETNFNSSLYDSNDISN